MKRFVTCVFIENSEETIKAYSETDNYIDAVNNADEYVWQFAETKEQAIKQHYDKFLQWELNPTKETY